MDLAAPLNLLPAPAHRAALICAHSIRRVWWRVMKPRLTGCNVVVTNPAGEVLLVQHSYQAKGHWMLPGGAIGAKERPENAAIREVREEAGCRLRAIQLLRVEQSRDSGARLRIHVFTAETTDEPRPDQREILAARFFPRDALPDSITRVARRRIEFAEVSQAQNSAS